MKHFNVKTTMFKAFIRHSSLIALALTVFLSSCEKEDTIDPSLVSSPGVYILNQGLDGKNNAGLSYYSFATGETKFDIFDGKLGDTGQDMMAYGSKLYITVSKSSVITVLDLKKGNLLKLIAVKNGDQPRSPRYLTYYEGNVYASTYDGNVIRIDTTQMEITGITAVGSNPEGIAAAEGKLYVANSNGLNFPNLDKTLSVVDIATFKETEKITVGLNPFIVKADQQGDIYLTYLGNYAGIPGGFQRINTKTKEVTDINITANQQFTIMDDKLYYIGVTYNADYSTNCSFGIFDVNTETSVTNQFISDDTTFNTAYGIGVDPNTSDVYIANTDYSNPGTVLIFDKNGKKKKTLNVGINACRFAFN
jgi:YVTN family beta-propeller protein